MTNLVDMLEQKELVKADKRDVVAKDLSKFMKDYKKFKDAIDKEHVDDKLQRALNKIDDWVKELDRRGGLPVSYPRYEQFTWVMASFDDEANNGRGGLYDKDVTNAIIKYWKYATGYKIFDLYKNMR